MGPAIQPLGTAYDLTGLINTLSRRSDKSSKTAGRCLKNLRDTKSAVNDLVFAMELILYIRGHDPDGNIRKKTMPAAVVGACFSQAILLYIRATEAGGQRRSLKIKSKLSADQKVVHKRLNDLRNKVIAHLDDDRSYGNKSFAEQNSF